MALTKPSTCSTCPLFRAGSGFARTDGNGHNTKVLVVAEALGANEAAVGRPLVGTAGKVWDRIVSGVSSPLLGRSLHRDDFLYDNCIHCQPPGNILVGAPYERAALDSCRPYLEETLREFNPSAILTLGNVPLRWFTGEWGIEQLRGYVFPSPWGPVIPTYHPAYIARGKWNLARVVQLDILKALEVAKFGSAKLYVEKAYELSPGEREVRAFVDGWLASGRPPIAFDIETPRDDEAAANEDMVFEDAPSYTILMVSLSYEPFKAISIPWIEPFIGHVKRVFRESADFVVWNAAFDVPRLIANGVHFGGRIIDSMIAWHWLEPSLPMGLKYVATFFCPDMGAWKLDMHKNFAWYNAADSDVLLRVYLEVKSRLEAQGRWRTFERHFLDFGKILTKMTERGVSIDHVARGKAREHFQNRFVGVVERAQELAPIGVRALHPKRGYKLPPKDTTGMVQIEVELTEAEELKLKAKREKERERARKQKEKEQRRRDRALAREAKAREKLERAAARAAARVRKAEMGGGRHLSPKPGAGVSKEKAKA